nr:RNA-directed DNA polymerase, eukaryota, nucleotide-binding alpha-beta plait domain protein [Tanacetum cinerariifolium]
MPSFNLIVRAFASLGHDLGGFSVRIDAGSITSKEKMLSHVRVASWFSELQHATDYFVTEERLVWISIEGLPKVTWKFSSCKDCFLMGFTVWCCRSE